MSGQREGERDTCYSSSHLVYDQEVFCGWISENDTAF